MPLATVIVPCFNEEAYLGDLLAGLVPQCADNGFAIVLVDDSSTDATCDVIAEWTTRHEGVTSTSGRFGTPGGARSAGVAAALTQVPPQWLITVDADVTLADTWGADWRSTLNAVDSDERCGAVNGVEVQDHLYADHPNARKVSAAFGIGIGAGEAQVGVTNLNGVNHAVRVSAYLTAGPYLQPTAPGPNGLVSLAGEDWDLGVRLRRAGYRISETPAAVIDRGRRLLTDVHAYVSGEAYEGAFTRLAPSADGPRDVPSEHVDALIDGAVRRSLRHFLLKTLLAEPSTLDEASGLSAKTKADMRAWMAAWPHPTFEESRNGFIFGRLDRFAAEFVPAVRSDLHLDLPAVLDKLR